MNYEFNKPNFILNYKLHNVQFQNFIFLLILKKYKILFLEKYIHNS